MTDFGLWTRRFIAIAIISYAGFFVYKGQLTAQDIKELAMIVITFYFAQPKENS